MSIELADENKQIIILRLISLIENNISELDIFVTRLQRIISKVQTNLQFPIKFNEDNIQEIYKILPVTAQGGGQSGQLPRAP
jgi:hypothetical protein